MGFGGGKTFLGLFEKEQLVAVAVFSKTRHMKREDPPYYSTELERFCSIPDTTIVGGLDKFIQYFRKEHLTDDLITYIDKEWSKGEAYLKLGFKKVGETPPLRFIINKTTQKRRLANVNETLKTDEYAVINKGNLKLRLYFDRDF
mgnify:CR=1 FL=1